MIYDDIAGFNVRCASPVSDAALSRRRYARKAVASSLPVDPILPVADPILFGVHQGFADRAISWGMAEL